MSILKFKKITWDDVVHYIMLLIINQLFIAVGILLVVLLINVIVGDWFFEEVYAYCDAHKSRVGIALLVLNIGTIILGIDPATRLPSAR